MDTIERPEVLIIPDFVSDHEALYRHLMEVVRWDEGMSARKTACFGRPYQYSQMRYEEAPMSHALEAMARALRARLGVGFNSCLLNYYETGDNRMGFHADDTRGLVPGTGIGIVSLGSERALTYRRKRREGGAVALEVAYALAPGSLLYMGAEVQERWEHALKRAPGAGPRISLTWRAVA
jgi:alkylated DNA repair dioxygenase AlkB